MEEAPIARAQAGDEAALRQAMEFYAPLVWRTALVLLADRAAAEDAVQEAWIDVWKGLPRFQVGRPFRPWLLAIVANRCRMTARRHVLPMVSLDEEDADEISGDDDVLEAAVREESHAELAAVLEQLPEDQRRILQLRYFADLELAEIALVLGVPLGTVKSRLHRALAALRRLLAASETDWRTEDQL